MTEAERQAYNAGVAAVLTIAERAAAAIERTSNRPIAEGFAVAVLRELADAGRALALPAPGTAPEGHP